MVTNAAANHGWPGDVAISDLATAGLPAAAVVRSAKIATIEARDAEPIGTLPPSDRVVIAASLRDHMCAALTR